MQPGTVWKQLLHNKRLGTLAWGTCLVRAVRWVRRKIQFQHRISMRSWQCTEKVLVDLARAKDHWCRASCLADLQNFKRNHMMRRRKVTSRHFVHIWFLSICWWLCTWRYFAKTSQPGKKWKFKNARYNAPGVLTFGKYLLTADTVPEAWENSCGWSNPSATHKRRDRSAWTDSLA